MIYHVLCVRDRAADVFGVPSFHSSVGAAIRAFGDEINRAAQDNAFYNHPEDFDMYKLGTYDDTLARFETTTPAQVAIGKDLKR